MSANDQVVIVDQKDGTWQVWYDSCVDNPFPMSARLLSTHESVVEATNAANDLCDGYVEYGIAFVNGPVYELSDEEADALWEETKAEAERDLMVQIAAGACSRCSSPGMATYHSTDGCERDPSLARNKIIVALRENCPGVDPYYVAKIVLDALA